jgi:hypothetical protein
MGALSFMMRYPELIVKASFLFYPICLGCNRVGLRGSLGTTRPSYLSCMACCNHAALSICRWFLYKKQVPFAAAILRCALTALRLNPATYALSLVIAIIHAVTIVYFRSSRSLAFYRRLSQRARSSAANSTPTILWCMRQGRCVTRIPRMQLFSDRARVCLLLDATSD